MAVMERSIGYPFTGVKDDFMWGKLNDCMTIARYIGKEKEIRIPSQIEGMPVSVILDTAFWGEENNLTRAC